ncbi:tetratricopeptide repeat protein [Leptothoe sp. PORK10 BA2]|uniref:tetratricopeptide repeat protein n=1 Tax=Leptothoe sp. PORK10 BA2 TaxID=3110254 RepID=UPI002B211CAD|nr:tetratricopeptide repeat protein [Leptothoe sp. PORK10 BA2]MEA5465082.1 tetratricopeptide repeat protein [Leptothoe sp. PORK10 BA2]
MGRRDSKRSFRQLSNLSKPSLGDQINQCYDQGLYQQALTKLKQAQKINQASDISLSEADILLAWGIDDSKQGAYRKAEKTLRQAMELGAVGEKGEAYYWLAKSLVEQEQPQAALDLIQTAFETNQLHKQQGGCYLKLLVLNDRLDTLAELIEAKKHRFYAAQLHWARGVLSLHQKSPADALTHFKKMGNHITPGDWSSAWTIYTKQQTDQWSGLEQPLGLSRPTFGYSPLSNLTPKRDKHPAIVRLALVQLAHTFSDDFSEHIPLDALPPAQKRAVMVLETLRMIDEDEVHDAAHLFLNILKETLDDFPLLQELHDPLMTLAGADAMRTDEPHCAEKFWSRLVTPTLKDPQIAIHLRQAMFENGSEQAAMGLIKQLIQWVETQTIWSDQQRRAILTQLHCWTCDHLINLKKIGQAEQALKAAIKLNPDAAPVVGRQGLLAANRKHYQQAIPLLTQALKGGSDFVNIYETLTDCLEKTGDTATLKQIRREYGKAFGDLDTEPDIPRWQEIFTYRLFFMLQDATGNLDRKDFPSRALKIFVDAVTDTPNKDQRVTFDQTEAADKWEALLAPLSPAQQVPVLQAICLVIAIYAKRKKGVAALESRYQAQLISLIDAQPEARIANLVYLAVKETKAERLTPPIESYLRSTAQPYQAIAQLQLNVRWFVTTPVLLPWIDQALAKEPQNPLLLIAKATLYPYQTREYQKFFDQGFDLARRLQQTDALDAYRDEEWLQSQAMTRSAMSGLGRSGRPPSMQDMVDMITKMAQAQFGDEIPPELMEQMILQMLAAEMGEAMPPGGPFGNLPGGGGFPLPMFGGFEDESDGFEDDFFRPLPGARKTKKSKRSKRS